jgi:hypothetical protein
MTTTSRHEFLKISGVAAPHGLMNAVRLLGAVSPRAQGFGMVLAKA